MALIQTLSRLEDVLTVVFFAKCLIQSFAYVIG